MKTIFKRFLILTVVLVSSITAWAGDVTYSPVLDVCFRTNAGNTAWNSGYPKDAASEGNTVFESNYYAGIFTMQKYTVPNLTYATSLTLTITVNENGSGVDGTWLWLYPNSDWTASSGVDDIVGNVTTLVGIAPRASEGTVNTPLVQGKKVSNSNPAQGYFTISGAALTALKASATSDGTFTVLITNNKLLEQNNSRKYRSSNSAVDEAYRPTLVATIESPAVINKTTGNTYSTLNAAFAALTDADTELEVYEDQTLTGRLTWSNAHTLTITPKKDITIKGHKNGMWFLVNRNEAVLNIGSDDYTMTLDGQNNEMGYDVTKGENATKLNLTNVVFQNFNLNNVGHLVGSKATQEVVMTLDKVTFKNCVNPADAFINKLRVKNDYLVLKGWLNQENCTGITIYSLGETKSSGTTGRIKVNDNSFTANQPITINFDGVTKSEGILAVIGTKPINAVKFRLTDSDWTLLRKSNGDMYLTAAVAYEHPALLHNAADIARVKGLLTQEPFKSAYSALETASGGTAAGAVEWLKRMDASNWGPSGKNGQYEDYSNFSHAVTDAKLAYDLSLRYQLKGSTAAATAAVNILNDWAKNCKGFFRLEGYTNNIPDPNEYLMLIQAYQFANAAELLRNYNGWEAADFTAFKEWMRTTFADIAVLFLENHHKQKDLHYWLNWDLAALNALLSVGILCDDPMLVEYVNTYTTEGKGNGRAAEGYAFIATYQDTDSDETLAQCQESGRDQGHSTLDITLLGVLCQTAKNIGKDYFTPYKALEMAEYVGKYNLKNDAGAYCYDNMPFTEYTNGEVTHTAISSEDRGKVRPCWELFLAYAQKNDKQARYCQQWSEWARRQKASGEDNGTNDELGFSTLMYMSGNAADYSYTAKVSDAGAATLILAFDAAIPSGVKAYTLTYKAGQGAVTMTEVTTTIPANTPVLIVASAGSYTFNGSSIWKKATTATAGALTGVFSKTIVPNGSYILTKKDGVLAFRKVDGTTNYAEANHAYLTAATSAPILDINFDGNVTGISQIENGELKIENSVFDLKGQRVSNPTNGLYIINGKKIVIRK